MTDRLQSELIAQEAREYAQDRREAAAAHIATGIATDAIYGQWGRRDELVEHWLGNETDLNHLLRDLVDDIQAGIDPSTTLRKAINDWALGVAIEEESWR
jgi:hypothetical protein